MVAASFTQPESTPGLPVAAFSSVSNARFTIVLRGLNVPGANRTLTVRFPPPDVNVADTRSGAPSDVASPVGSETVPIMSSAAATRNGSDWNLSGGAPATSTVAIGRYSAQTEPMVTWIVAVSSTYVKALGLAGESAFDGRPGSLASAIGPSWASMTFSPGPVWLLDGVR